jgi:uncharacterized membrane protein YphA (DoxX/SURF4 family)
MDDVTLAFRFLLAAIFGFAGLAKLPQLDGFESAVRRYALLPEQLVRPIARALPPIELGGGLLLALGLGVSVVSGFLAAILLVFAAAVAVNLLRGRVIDCGCFSTVAPKRISWSAVARNMLLAGAAVTLAARGADALALDGLLTSRHSAVSNGDAAAIMLAVVAGVAAWALSGAARAFQRVANARRPA